MLAAEEANFQPPAPLSEGASAVPSRAPPSGKPAGIHQPLEKPVKRKLAKGRLPIEARIDLHGLYQSEAHDLLLDFLFRAHDRGMRHVLVITGKGSSMGSDGVLRSEEHTSELQSLMRISYAVFCLKKKKN